jgi:putative holliday junction resolvase
MRILAVDPGEKRIGLAISDPTQTIASRLSVILHRSFDVDIDQVNDVIKQNDVGLVIVGQALDDEGDATRSSRHAAKFGKGLVDRYQVKVVFYDESGTTNEAKQTAIDLGIRRKKRHGHLDDIAATILLQRYLDSLPEQKEFTR